MAAKNPCEDIKELSAGQHQLPDNIKDWTKDHVKQWILKEKLLDSRGADTLYQQNINGVSLLLLEKSELIELDITLGPAKVVIHNRDELVRLKKDQVSCQGRPCKPYPFNRFHYAGRYKINDVLDVPESGPLNLIEPCHEFKAFINFENTSREDKLQKFTNEVIRFAAACMNCRTNGTIHFGVGDKPDFVHGQILGTEVNDKEAFVNALDKAVEGHFEHKHIQEAKKCIKPPRFVEVLNPDMTSSEKYVIEVDVEPTYFICQKSIFYVFSVDSRKAKKNKNKDQNKEQQKKKCLYIRDGTSSRDIVQVKLAEHDKFVDSIEELSESRKNAEEKHLADVKCSDQGFKLIQMVTGGTLSLDKSHFERYILVTNKSHAIQLESMEFLLELNPTAVLDFDPESRKNGLFKYFDEQRNTNVHFPAKYKITEAVETIAGKLKLTKNTSWVFCNGCDKTEMPSDLDNWLNDKGAAVRDVISFLCRKDIMPQNRFLVVFLLLSGVNDKMDPLLETFSIFRQELKGVQQILCLCENEMVFTSWKDLIESRYNFDITSRSIYALSLAEINGTILTLWSANRRSSRFLPCGGGTKVLLRKKVEDSLDSLSILCINQCEGGTSCEDKHSLEENFYKGGKVSWWNFYFSENPGSSPFIKRDSFDFISKKIIPELLTLRQGCVYFNVLHLPGCGGTTLAMHVLWSQKESFRCAVLKEGPIDLPDVASQVVQLLTYETVEHSTRLPVLLLLDEFEDMDAVFDLQKHIDKELVEKHLSSKGPQVILLNCMREEVLGHTESMEHTVFIDNKLSPTEQQLFQKKLEEIDKSYNNSETFYGFMILKKNFMPEYTQGIARHTLKNFSFVQDHAQLFAVLVLLNVYCKNAAVSVSLCEEFLQLETKPYCGSRKTVDAFEKFSNLVTRCTFKGKVCYDAVKAIHPSIAESCLQEFTNTYSVTRTKIINLLLTNDRFFECVQGKEKLMQDIRSILVKRRRTPGEESGRFSPLIQDIAKESPGAGETVLSNAVKRFDEDAIMSQLLARYYYIEKKNFQQAKEWAKKAKNLSPENSYIADTSAQIIKHELNFALTRTKEQNLVKPEELQKYLKMAVCAAEAFRETREIAKQEISMRHQRKWDSSPFNTSGYVGEIQVAGLILDILGRTPVFTQDDCVRYSILKLFLSGQMKIQDISRMDKHQHLYAPYYEVINRFSDVLRNLWSNMKDNFDFLDRFFVNLRSAVVLKDTREERTRSELERCFSRYTGLFCNPDLLNQLNRVFPAHMTKTKMSQCMERELLEKLKADTPSRLLNFLTRSIPSEEMEQIVTAYAFLIQTNDRQQYAKHRINYIYANVVLHGIKPTSKVICLYSELLKMLHEVIADFTLLEESMAKHFIAVALLWPHPSQPTCFSDQLESWVSQLSTSFHRELRPVYHNKWPVVHFYLGKKHGYDRLVSQDKIEKYVNSEEQFGYLWRNGGLWSQKEVSDLLCRVTGEVRRNVILANTSIPHVKIPVIPFVKSQLCGGGGSNCVSFFIGFSMKGPLAFDVKFDS